MDALEAFIKRLAAMEPVVFEKAEEQLIDEAAVPPL